MGFVKRAWYGEERLWKVFLIYGVLGYFIVVKLSMAVRTVTFNYILTADNSILGTIIRFILMVTPFVLLSMYVVYMSVGLWRCARNVKTKFFYYVARAIAFCLMLVYIVYFGIGFLIAL